MFNQHYEPRYKKKSKIWKYVKRVITIFFLIFLIFFLTSYFYVRGFERKIQSGKAVEKARKELSTPVPTRPTNILILGTDAREKFERGRSDTIIIASIHPGKKRAVLISIPRDLRVKIPGYGYNKINSAYALEGPSLTIQTVEKYSGLEIHHFAVVDFRGFARIVDALGGVTLNVEKRMVDPRNKIYLSPGERLLNGEEALGYVRFRKDPKGDFGRIERQQKFFRALLDKALNLSSVLKIPRLASIVSENLSTNMSVREMVSLARPFLSIKQEDVKTIMLPGEPKNIHGSSYVIPDQEKIDEIFYWVKKECTLPKEEIQLSEIKIEIRNGCGKAGWAKTVGEKLKAIGFKIKKMGDASSYDFKKTLIYYTESTEDGREKAEKVKKILGLGKILLRSQKDFLGDVLVVLGEDSLKERVFQLDESSAKK